MKSYQLGVLYGDGIGREIVSATLEVLHSIIAIYNLNIELRVLPIGHEGIKQYGHPTPLYTVEALKKMDGWVMGPHDASSYPEPYNHYRNPSGELRSIFDLFANIRPARSIDGVPGVVDHADLIIYRENTEGFYPDRNMYSGKGEWMITSDVVITTGVFTRAAIERIAKVAFEKAQQRRKKVTIVHKANVINKASGLFKDICYEIAEQYPDIIVDDYHVDAMAAHLVRRISDFDIIVTENMFGDILSDLTGELVGSIGLAPSINTNYEQAMAQATHGSAPNIANKGIANPVGIMWSTIMLLQWLAQKNKDETLFLASEQTEKSMLDVIASGQTTPDLGGNESTESFTQLVVSSIENH